METLDRRQLLNRAGLGAGALILGGIAVDPVAAQRPGALCGDWIDGARRR
jgi:hypothetical protein